MITNTFKEISFHEASTLFHQQTVWFDLEIDPASGKVNFIKVKDGFRILSFLKNNNDIEIPWNKIIKIGNDVIIVDTYLNVNSKKEEK